MSWPLVDPQRIKDGMAAAKVRGVKVGRPKADVCKREHWGAPRNKGGACAQCDRERAAKRYTTRREEILACTRKRQTEQRRADGIPVRREGPDLEKLAITRNACAALRRARLLQQTPPWADIKKIKNPRRMQRDLGVKMAVDHIIPLKGEAVSGLHVYGNLRVIPLTENAKKYNSYQCT
jgi:hypothetical protein